MLSDIEVVDAEIVEDDLTAQEVKVLLSRIFLLRGNIRDTFVKYVELVTRLYSRRAWITAGLPSWEAFAEANDLPVNLPREDRQKVSVALSAAGMSTRAIAVTQGVSNKTIHGDITSAAAQAGVTSGNTTSAGSRPMIAHEDGPIPVSFVESSDEQFEDALTRAKSKGNLSRDAVASELEAGTPARVTGPDGKSYPATHSASTSRRGSLPNSFRSAIYELDRATARVEKLVASDRFAPNRAALHDDYWRRVLDLGSWLDEIWNALQPPRAYEDEQSGGADG